MKAGRVAETVLLGVLLSLSSVSIVDACSAVLQPIQDVIRQSEVILRAKVRFARAAASPIQGRVTFDVLEVIKGIFAGRHLTIAGRITDTPASRNRQPPHQQLDCMRAGGCGGCFAYDYRDGAEYLLMLKGGTPYWAPLAPTNEEISGAQDPWVLWVKGQLSRKNP